MDASRSPVWDTAGKPWEIWIDSPIGKKQSTIVLRVVDDQLHGDMTDLFGTRLPMLDMQLSDTRMAWRLEITRPIKVSLLFEGHLAGRVIQGVIRSKYPDIPFSGLIANA